MAVEEYCGICDLCGKPADARIEDCHTLVCTANCNREGGDLYHADCLKKFIATGAKGTAKHIPKIPYTNFPCPKGKGRGSDTVRCKGLAAHCKRVIVKAEPKVVVPPQVLLQNERRQKPKPDPKAKPPAPPKPAKPKAPPLSDFNPRAVIRLPPVPTPPKADPLGRNLNGTPQQELPPGYDQGAQEEVEKAKGKAAKKNQKRAAKRQQDEAGSSQWDASSTTTADMPLLEDVLEAPANGAGDRGGTAGGEREGEGTMVSGGRFVADIAHYHALLGYMDYSDSDVEYIDTEEEEEGTGQEAESAPLQWAQQQAADSGDMQGWQTVDGRGKANPAAPPPRAAAAGGPQGASQAADDPEEVRRREEELLKAALEASLNEVAAAGGTVGAAAAAAAEDDFEAALARAMQESLAAEQAQRQLEQQQQAALLATLEKQRQQQQQAAGVGDPTAAAAWLGVPGSVSNRDRDSWGSAVSNGPVEGPWGLPQPTQNAAPPPQPQPQQTAHMFDAYRAVPPAALAATATTTGFNTVSTPLAAYAVSTAAGLSATYSAPAVTTATAAYQPAAVQQQQQQAPVPWLQPASLSAPALPPGFGGGHALAAAGHKAATAAPAAPAPAGVAAAADEDDDLDSLLALLNV